MEPAIKQTPANTPQLVKDGRRLFSISDDNAILKQLEATHDPDEMNFVVQPLLLFVENIFHRANQIVDAFVEPGAQAPKEALEDNIDQDSFIDMLEFLTPVFDRISCELTCNCSDGGNAHATTISILKMLSYYSWDCKSVIALSAFAVKYGEFWQLAQSSTTTNQLTKSVAVLKQLPQVLMLSSVLKTQFDVIKSLIKAITDINKCVVKFSDLPEEYLIMDVAAQATARIHTPMAVYWTIRSFVLCAAQMTDMVRLGQNYKPTHLEVLELSSSAHMVDQRCTHLKAQLNSCKKHIDEMKSIEAYQNLVNLFEVIQTDNMKVLKALLNPKTDPLPLNDGASKKRVNLDGLRQKFVLLLISDLDIPQEELAILEQMYNESRQHLTRTGSQYEVVWLPAVQWSDSMQKQYENLQANMLWYTVHPSLIDRPVIRFVKERWHFLKKPILVVLDPQGQVASPNALHMMWIWGSQAFPFTTTREEALWKEETWRLELLVDGIDPMILNWISEGRFICMYGGEDIEWIRKFTSTARAVAQAAGISLGMVYLGKSNPKEGVRRNIVTINVEKLSHCWQDLSLIWYFWVRLQSMWHSKTQLGRSVEDDPIMQQIMTMLSFDGSEGGWAVLSRGSAEMTKAKGNKFLIGLLEYDQWKEHVQPKGFVQALHDHLMQIHTPHHCNRLVLPGTAGIIPEKVVCSECGRTMERFIMYKCCDE